MGNENKEVQTCMKVAKCLLTYKGTKQIVYSKRSPKSRFPKKKCLTKADKSS